MHKQTGPLRGAYPLAAFEPGAVLRWGRGGGNCLPPNLSVAPPQIFAYSSSMQ